MNGALAHLARATDWQSVGDFVFLPYTQKPVESDMLHFTY